jgi:hypothetical protein
VIRAGTQKLVISSIAIVVIDKLKGAALVGKKFPEGHRLGGYAEGLAITASLANE